MPLLKLPGPSLPSPLLLPEMTCAENQHSHSPSPPLKRPASPSFDIESPSTITSAGDDYLEQEPLSRKRSKTDDPLLQIFPPEQAWTLPAEVLTSQLPDARCFAQNAQNGTIVETPWGAILEAGKSLEPSRRYPPITVFAVLGMQVVQYQLLSMAIPTLKSLSPTLQIAAISHSLSLFPTSSPLDPSIPLINPIPSSLLLRLGLVHPLGGGHMGLDAITILDWAGRRRCVIPIGWGAGVGLREGGVDEQGLVAGRVVDVIVQVVGALEEERERERGM